MAARLPFGVLWVLGVPWLCAGVALGAGPRLVVELPEKTQPKSAVAITRAMKLQSDGAVDGRSIVFEKLLPDTPYDVEITLADGTLLRGVDMTWYNDEPAKPDAREANEDDREQIRKLVQDVRQFYDRADVLLFAGDHNRGVALVQQIRDSAFHSDKGGEVIWRIELWYFKNQHGGWERVSQQNKVLERQRFASKAAYRAATERIRWVSVLGGIRIAKDKSSNTIVVPAEAMKPTTTPAAFGPAKE